MANHKLLSGRVKVTPAANVASDRHNYLSLDQAEPNLGVANGEGFVLTYDSNAVGKRSWQSTSNLNNSHANSAYIHANSAFDFANTVSGGSAIDNTARALANTADQKAVTSGSYANSAFTAANTSDQKAVTSGLYANAAFDIANSASSYANGAFGAANTADQRAVTSGVYANAAFASSNTRLSTSGGTISGDLIVTGNLSVEGATVTVNVTTLAIEDSLIQLGKNNTSDSIDIGFLGHYNNGSANIHTGLFRRAADDKYYLFENWNGEPTGQTIDISNPTFTIATLSANLTANSVLIRGLDPLTQANAAFTKANNALPLTGGTIAGNVTANSVIANNSIYAPTFYSTGALSRLDLSDIGLVTVQVAGQEFKFGASGIESSPGLYGGSFGGNKLSLNNETNLISNRYDTVKIQTGTTGTVVNEWTFSNNTLIFPDSTVQLTAYQGFGIDNTARTLANTADQRAVTSGSYANSAFAAANTADQKAVSAGSYANGAFVAANTADQRAVTSGSYANSAYTQANSNFTSAVTRLSITNSGTSAYLIDQYSGNNPTIYVSAGETIAFLLNNVTGHPFMIRVSSGGSNYDTGLTHVSTTGTVVTGSSAQGQTTGTLYWKVPFDLVGSTYVYQCSAHGGMVGNIVIQQPVSFVASNTVLALSQSNAAFLAANIADQRAVTSGSYANGAFAAANTADQKAVSAGSYANSAYLSQNTTGLYANSAYIHANAAFAVANAGGGAGTDTYARNHANAAFAVANTGGGAGTDTYARNHANSSYIHANAAFAVANTGGGGGGGSQTLFAVSLDSFTSNGQNTQFILSSTPADTKSLFVYVDGVYQLSNAYSLSTNTITLSEALDANSILEVRVFGNTTPSHINNRVNVFTGTGACTTFTLTTTPTDKNLTTVIVGGVQQLKSSYNIANSQIVFSEAPLANSDIEVSTYSGGGTHATSFKSVVDTFSGDNSTTTFTLTTTPSAEKETFAFLNGVYQQKNTYSISGANIIFTGTATSNDTIEVVTIAGSEMNVTSSRYNSRVYTGTGACTSFNISSSHSANSVLVFENGVCQEPITDYTVSGTVLTFTTAPSNGVKIQIRELPV